MRVSKFGLILLPAAMFLAAQAAAAVFPSGPSAARPQLATSEADALAKCGPKPAGADAWVCVGQPAPPQGAATNRPPPPEITWTWTKGGISATDNWSSPK